MTRTYRTKEQRTNMDSKRNYIKSRTKIKNIETNVSRCLTMYVKETDNFSEEFLNKYRSEGYEIVMC